MTRASESSVDGFLESPGVFVNYANNDFLLVHNRAKITAGGLYRELARVSARELNGLAIELAIQRYERAYTPPSYHNMYWLVEGGVLLAARFFAFVCLPLAIFFWLGSAAISSESALRYALIWISVVIAVSIGAHAIIKLLTALQRSQNIVSKAFILIAATGLGKVCTTHRPTADALI